MISNRKLLSFNRFRLQQQKWLVLNFLLKKKRNIIKITIITVTKSVVIIEGIFWDEYSRSTKSGTNKSKKTIPVIADWSHYFFTFPGNWNYLRRRYQAKKSIWWIPYLYWEYYHLWTLLRKHDRNTKHLQHLAILHVLAANVHNSRKEYLKVLNTLRKTG